MFVFLYDFNFPLFISLLFLEYSLCARHCDIEDACKIDSDPFSQNLLQEVKAGEEAIGESSIKLIDVLVKKGFLEAMRTRQMMIQTV